MDTKAFEADLTRAGYVVETSSGAPGKVTQPHTHAYDVRAMVLAGEFTLTCRGESQTFRAGQTFEMVAGCEHSENHGPAGTTVLVGRKHRA